MIAPPAPIALSWLWPMVMLALAVRVLVVAVVPGFSAPPSYDGITYDLLARNLVSGGYYGFTPADLTAFRPPGYPLMMALVYGVVGPSCAAVRVVNIGLSVATVWLVARLASTLFGREVAKWAALGVALHPVLIVGCGELYPEGLFLFLWSAATFLLVNGTRRRQMPRTLVAGVLLGVGVLARPNMAPLVPLAALGWFFQEDRRHAWRLATGLVVASAMVLLPWAIRNALRFGEFIPLTTQSGIILWQANNPHSTGGLVWPTGATWTDGPAPEQGVRGWEGLSESESSRRFSARAIEWMRENPLRAISLVPARLERLWRLTATSVDGSPRAPSHLARAADLGYAGIGLLALFGLVRTWRAWPRLWALYAPILTVHLSAVVFSGSARYAVPMALAVTCFAAAGWQGLRHGLARGRE